MAVSIAGSDRRGGGLGDLAQELGVVGGGAELLDEQLDALAARAVVAPVGVECGEYPTELPHVLKLEPVKQQLLVPCSRSEHVDRREYPAVGEAPVESQLHVPGAL